MKTACLLLATILLCFCAPSPYAIDKIIEDGVEVVLNHIDPYDIKGEPSNLSIKERFVIDLEDEHLASLGLTDVYGFDVNSEGDIYFFRPPLSQTGDLVFRFNCHGEFVSSFLPRGDGPGEIQFPSYQKINHQDELPVTDTARSKIRFYDEEGHQIRELPVGVFIGTMGNMLCPLKNGHYLIRRSKPNESNFGMQVALSLFDPEFKEIMELDSFELKQPIRSDRFRLPMRISAWCLAGDNICVGSEERGYEIRIYDLNGQILKKIRKEYRAVKVSSQFKREIHQKLEHSPPELKKRIYFPDVFPPFQFIFSDDEGHLFVMTYEKSQAPKSFVFDIFNVDGIFIGRFDLEAVLNDPFFLPQSPFDSWITMKKGRLYALREKDSGYKQLVIYNTNWQ